MPTRVCASCGRLWSSAVRRRFGERCPECEAEAADALRARPASAGPVVGRRAPRFVREDAAGAAPQPGRPSAPVAGDALDRRA
jgi:hypothetical protein